MGVLRSDRVSGLGGANAINGSVFFGRNGTTAVASGNWLTAHSDSDFNFGLGDFTIEYWFYFTGVTGSNSGCFQISNTPGGLKNSNTAADGGLALNYENNCVKGIGNNGWFNGSNTVAVGTWNHAALVRHSGTLQIFTNGVADTSASDSNNYALTHLAIGGYYTNAYLMTGYISNFRIVKGTAVYSAAFTPPTERLTAIDGTVLLACQSPGNIFQEATGKTLDIRKVTLNDAPPMASRFAPDKGEDHGTTFGENTKFDTLSYMVPPGGTTAQSNRGRGFRFGGDSTPSKTNHIEYVNIQSQGTAQDFGDLLTTLTQAHAGSSSIRSIIFAGYNAPATVSDIQYITNATQGNSIDAGINVGGDFTRYCNVVSNETRSVYGGGTPGYTATIEYVTNASLSSVTDFGDFSAGGMYSSATMNSSTRGIFAGGYYNPGGGATKLNTIQYITIMTTGNSQDFGDLVAAMGGPNGICCSPTRGIAWDNGNTIQYITISTLGNSVDFGDVTVAGFNSGVSFSSHTRGVAGGGYHSSTNNNWIEFVTISTTGNAQDFGDLRTGGSSMGGSSDCHGGIS